MGQHRGERLDRKDLFSESVTSCGNRPLRKLFRRATFPWEGLTASVGVYVTASVGAVGIWVDMCSASWEGVSCTSGMHAYAMRNARQLEMQGGLFARSPREPKTTHLNPGFEVGNRLSKPVRALLAGCPTPNAM